MELRKTFIRDTLIEKGHLTRGDICEKFTVTMATASMDVRLARIRWPDLMVYDRSRKLFLLKDKSLAVPAEITNPNAALPDTFFCQVGLKSGNFDSRIEFKLDGDQAAMKKFIESWLALMASAIKLGAS